MSYDIASWPTLLLHTKSKHPTMAESRPGVSKPRRVGGDGEPEVFMADEQQDLEIDLARWQNLALDVLRAEGVKGLTEMTVMFIDAPTMTELNFQYMGKSYATDVLSFPLDAVEATRSPGPGAMSKTPEPSPLDVSELPLLLGDVVICPSVAVEQAPRHAGTIDDELALLLVHGILHVLGNDHNNPEAEAAMHARERKHLEAFHWGHAAPEQFRHIQETDQ
jgi:probable rRNA maturation factor